MKSGKQETNSINFLHRKFKFLEKSDIRLILQFCDNRPDKTQKILMVMKDMPNPKVVTKMLMEKPQKSEIFLAGIQRQYAKKYAEPKKVIIKNQQNQQGAIDQSKFDFFYYLPMEACLSIMNFLDPYSFNKLSQTCKKLNKVSLSEGNSEYFRILCVNLFEKVKPSLPEETRFLQIRKYVLDHPKQFGPNTRNVVLNKLRYYIWQFHPVLNPKPKNYYQQFKGYKQIFIKNPRVHFNGFYTCKHQYRKQQQKDILQISTNVHLINYYRYFRFFDDGSVLSAVSPKKLKQNQISNLLAYTNLLKTPEQLEETNELMVGQYIHTYPDDYNIKQLQKQKKQEEKQLKNQLVQKLHVKVVKGCSIFNYELQINDGSENSGGAGRQLTVKKYWLKVVDQLQIVQDLQEQNHKFILKFKYVQNYQIARENKQIIRASSL